MACDANCQFFLKKIWIFKIMATPFFNTTRAIKADNHYNSVFILFVFLFILSIWLSWFTNLEIPLYERNLPDMVSISRNETIRTKFLSGSRPIQTKNRMLTTAFKTKSIKKGQQAIVTFQDKKNKKINSFQAQVYKVEWKPKDKISKVDLFVSYNKKLPYVNHENTLTNVRVIVGSTTPILIALDAIGKN